MPESVSSVRVEDNPARSRYEAFVGDELAGFVTYRKRPGVVALVHTEVDPDYDGHGIGSRLASVALEAARAGGERVEPICPFVTGYIERHPEYSDLVA